jgi:hypothetical protein
MYIRKTYDEYQIWSNYGYGWEETCAEETYKEAKERLKEYRENQPQYPHKIVKRQIRKDNDNATS